MIGPSVGVGVGHRFGGGFDPSASAFFTATGITGTTEQQAVNTLVTSLKSAGLWSKMKAVYPFVTDNRNLLSYTEDFSNAFWSKTNATITTNSITSPDGTLTADTASFSAGGFVGYSTTLSGNYTYSVYLKYKGSQWICVENYNASTDKAAWFDLQNGVVGTTAGGATSTITSVGNGWYRCSVTTNASSGTSSLFAFFTTSTNGGFTRNNDVYAWGAQLELGSTATTYQPIATTQQSYISNQFKYNLVNPVDSDAAFRGVFNGGFTFSSTGATGNGINAYMDTKFLLGSSNSFSYNNFHFAHYSRTNSLGGVQVDMGAGVPSTYNNMYHAISGNYGGTLMSKQLDVSTTNSLGFLIKTATSATNAKLYKNGNLTLTDTSTQTATTDTNLNCSIFAQNIGNQPSSRQCAFASIGLGITDSEATALYNAVQAMNTTLQRQV